MTHSELPFATLFGFPFGAQSESEERALVAFGAPVQSAHPRRPGTESGPAAIRQASSDALQAWLSSPSRAAVDLSTGITRRLRDLKASLDLGDLQCDGPVSAKSIAVVAHATAAIVESGGLPVLLGGDQRVFEGLVRGVQGASSPSGHSPGIPCFSDRINLPAAIDSEALPLAALATALDGDCPLLCVGVNGLQSGQAWEALERTGGRIVSADELYDDPAQASVTIKDFLRKHQSIDGHLDFADRLGAWGTHNHATNGRRNSELPNIERANMVWIGITGWVDGDELSHIEGMGGKIFSSADVHELGAKEVARRAVAHATRGCESLYLSIDIDAMDAGFLPGTGSIVPSGITPRQYCELLDVIAQQDIDGIDIAEVAPSLDPSGRTERISAHLLFRVLRRRLLESVAGQVIR